MGRRSFVVDLSAADKAWLDQKLINGGFQGYEDLAEQLGARGVKSSTSAVGRYGQQLQRQIEAIKASTEAAKMIAAASPDEADARSAAVISLFQSGLFDAMLSIRDMEEEMDPVKRMVIFGKSARGLASLTRASITQKKWSQEVNARLDAAKAQAVDAAERHARKAGMSDDQWGLIRAEILGIEVQA
ncbi:MAG: phage protein Gp27 family protein [Candidatus Sedimenticola sp. (ex Thyasira tokunagai)]